MNRLVILSLALAALTASASGRASKECGATEAVQWLACCPIPLKNGVLLETTCPRDFSISDSAAAKTCYYDCAYKENGLIMDDGTLIRDKIEEYSKNYFAGHPEYQDTVAKAVEMAFEKIQGSQGKITVGDKECDQTAVQFTLTAYNYVLRNCPNFVDSQQCTDLKASGC